MKRGLECEVHEHGSNVPQEDHHILPQEYGGKTVKANIARICSNAHGDVHYYIALLMKYDGLDDMGNSKVPWNITRTFGYKTQRLAERGYAGIVQGMSSHQLEDVRRREITYTLEEEAA